MKARATMCQTNLRTIHRMVMMYWDDYKNGLPDKSPSPSTQSQRDWGSLLWEHYMGGIKTMRFADRNRKVFLLPIRRGSVFACPELSVKNPNRTNISSNSYTHQIYTMIRSTGESPWTEFYGTRPKYTPWNVNSPSKCLFLADYNGSGTFGSNYLFVTVTSSSCRFDWRHPGRRVNVLFLAFRHLLKRKIFIINIVLDNVAQ